MPKLDLKKEMKPLYTASAKTAAFVEAGRIGFLMIDGYGHPDNAKQEFERAIELLYSSSFTLKFQSKKADADKDWVVMPLEGLWWHENPKADWNWTLMIAQPSFVTNTQVKAVLQELNQKKRTEDYAELRFERFTEGKCVQVLHVGPYSAEEPTIQRMSEFARANGYELAGKHHEIYVTDPNRVPPERLKTILRYTVKKTALRAKA
jgi:hypothetical protein